MSTVTSPRPRDDLERRIRAVRAPRPVMARARERELSDRQREILDELGRLFDDGFAHLTMADLAARVNCSLRTLYGLAPSRDELVLTVVDRSLRRVGRSAVEAIDEDLAALDAIRAYLRAANVAVSRTTHEFARDLAAVPEAQDLSNAHSQYLVDVTRALLDIAVERGDIAAVDTAATARVIAGLGRDFSRPDVMQTLSSSPESAANEMVDTIIAGLVSRSAETEVRR